MGAGARQPCERGAVAVSEGVQRGREQTVCSRVWQQLHPSLMVHTFTHSAGCSARCPHAGAAARPVHTHSTPLTLAFTLQVVLVALPGVDIEALQREVEKQCAALPRNETARKALSHSYVVKVRGSFGEREVCI